MEINVFEVAMQQAVEAFFDKCFTAVGIPYSTAEYF